MKSVSDSKILFWLSLGGITPRKQTELIRKCGSLSELWESFAFSEKLKEFIGEKAFASLNRFHSDDFINLCLEKLRGEGINVITAINPLFPKLLLQPEVNAPLVLYYRGDINVFKTECVAVVGTRACSSYGKLMAKVVAGELAENGVTVVSGLATGIDAYAHAAALDAKGKTIAVMAGGLDKITPVSNLKLYERILSEGGLVISEHTPNTEATKYSFPERNRIISGLSRGVAVIEAGEKSGALITARLAAEQNREVFCVPGNVTSSKSKGCLDLLMEGANLIRNGKDILEYLSIKPLKQKTKSEIIVDKVEKKVYSLLEAGIKSLDGLIEECGIGPQELMRALVNLELNDLIVRDSANTFSLKKPDL